MTQQIDMKGGVMCRHSLIKLEIPPVTGRFEKRDGQGDDTGFPFYCDGQPCVCSRCGDLFLRPFNPHLYAVPLEPIPLDPTEINLSKRP